MGAEQSGRESAEPSRVVRFVRFLLDNKAWWLVPIALFALLLGAIILVSSSRAAPFMYRQQ